jgi:hypothetical protein
MTIHYAVEGAVAAVTIDRPSGATPSTGARRGAAPFDGSTPTTG